MGCDLTSEALTASVLFAWLICASAAATSPHILTSRSIAVRSFQVSDSIEMTHVEETNVLSGNPAQFSPNAKNIAVVTYRGNLKRNTNDYRLLLFHVLSGQRPEPEVLLTVPSASNSPGISNVRWAGDDVLIFLANIGARKQQIYSLDLHTRNLKQLTNHPTDVLAFDATADSQTLAYLARRPNIPLMNKAERNNGVVISDQAFVDLLIGQNRENVSLFASSPELFLKAKDQPARKVNFPNKETLYPWFGVSLSHDGRFAIVLTDTYLYEAPARWSEYRVNRKGFITYLLVDCANMQVRDLLDAPAYSGSAVWSGNRSAIVTSTYLPLNIGDGTDIEMRKANPWTVQVDIDTGKWKPIAEGKFVIIKWDANRRILWLSPLLNTTFTVSHIDTNPVAYQYDGAEWKQVDKRTQTVIQRGELGVWQEQDLNSPPLLLIGTMNKSQKSLLADPNPQFQQIRFGHVEEITWKGQDDADIRGGLYLPIDYSEQKRYPLIIQTHGWDPTKFEVDGISTAGYAAQALAGSGFVVAQVPEAKALSNPLEGPENMTMFEGLIDSLDKRGLIDRSRVGILGYSRTGFAVWYTIAFSSFHFAAASIVDGSDGGYWEYVAELNRSAAIRDMYEGQNSGSPFGRGLTNWERSAPGFNLDRVRAPVREVGCGPRSLQYNWEPFVGLKRLGKPIELVWLPEAEHHPVKPSERMTAQQGNVDWFRFWLQDYEDPDPGKQSQYIRWRKLRKMHNEQPKN